MMRILIILCCLLVTGCNEVEQATSFSEHEEYYPAATETARLEDSPVQVEAVGTVQARTDIRVEAQVTGRVLNVNVRPGDSVVKGQELVILDSRQSRSRLDQARQGLEAARSEMEQAARSVSAAKAAYDKARTTYARMKTLHEQNVITAEEAEQAESRYLQAKAELSRSRAALQGAQSSVKQAQDAVHEADIGLDYTTITAQEDGEVAKRFADPGDLAFPGKELLTLQTGGSLRLEAQVREGLISRLRIGQQVTVVITALGTGEALPAVVHEIEPLADPATRSFIVKADLPDRPGLYPGMFGRLLIPLGTKRTVTIPAAAVTRVGQLETIMVKTEAGWRRVNIRTGKRNGSRIEVLSGLQGGETIGTEETGQ